jgi:hypothetical protein
VGDARHAPPAHTRGAGAFLSLIASGRSWERPSWQRYFGVTPKEIDTLRRVVRATLADGPLTREEPCEP